LQNLGESKKTFTQQCLSFQVKQKPITGP